MLKPGMSVWVTSPDGKLSYAGVLIEKAGNFWKLTVVDPRKSGYKRGAYVAAPVSWITAP